MRTRSSASARSSVVANMSDADAMISRRSHVQFSSVLLNTGVRLHYAYNGDRRNSRDHVARLHRFVVFVQ
jgi:hypothetical protein